MSSPCNLLLLEQLPESTFNNGKVRVYSDHIVYDAWVGEGILTNRNALGIDSPDQTYNYLKSFGIRPEKFGIANPEAAYYSEKLGNFSDYNREELIGLLIEQEKHIEALHSAGF